MTKRLIIMAIILTGLFLPAAALAEDASDHKEWNFTVSLDGDPVGTHEFSVDGASGQWRVSSKASFAVTLLGVTVFRYHHTAHEEWSGQCLSQLTADTDHDGDTSHVTAQASDSGGIVRIEKDKNESEETRKWAGCLMTYAYWNPDMRKQHHLLNPETGEIETVTITQEQGRLVTSRGQQVLADVWRITGSTNPIDILYDHDGNWIGLDATVRGGCTLSYRLP